jgi:uncharacterized protein GlcG (DUF336 family)
MRTKHSLTLADAKTLLEACRVEAEKNKWNVSISIVDEGGYQILMERMDGASLPSAEIARGKARAAALSRTATKNIEDTIKDRPAMLTFPDRIGVQGGVPLMHDGQCVGGIGVSGVKSHEDEQVALAGAKALAA